MMDYQTTGNAIHPILSFWLDVFVKVVAIALGGLWTFWNYLKSRPYSQRLDLQIEGDVIIRNGLYVDVNVALKNLGNLCASLLR